MTYELVKYYKQIEHTLVVPAPATDIELWVAAVVANGGSVSGGRQTTVNTLISGLKSDGLWTKLDRLWLFAGENAGSALTDIKSRTLATAVNTPTLTTDRGYTFNASNNYIDTLYIPSAPGQVLAQNSGHLSCYERVKNSTVFGCPVGAGDFDVLGSAVMILYTGGGVDSVTRMNENVPDTTGTTTAGMLVVTRNNSTTRLTYNNGSLFLTDTATTVATLIGYKILVGALSDDGVPANFGNSQVSAVSLGSGLDATEAGNLSSRINTYMTSVGANVY